MRRLVLLCVVSVVCCAQAVSLVPQPRKLVEKGGVTTNAAVRYVTDAAIPAEGYRPFDVSTVGRSGGK